VYRAAADGTRPARALQSPSSTETPTSCKRIQQSKQVECITVTGGYDRDERSVNAIVNTMIGSLTGSAGGSAQYVNSSNSVNPILMNTSGQAVDAPSYNLANASYNFTVPKVHLRLAPQVLSPRQVVSFCKQLILVPQLQTIMPLDRLPCSLTGALLSEWRCNYDQRQCHRRV